LGFIARQWGNGASFCFYDPLVLAFTIHPSIERSHLQMVAQARSAAPCTIKPRRLPPTARHLTRWEALNTATSDPSNQEQQPAIAIPRRSCSGLLSHPLLLFLPNPRHSPVAALLLRSQCPTPRLRPTSRS
jgi:hypothetical protein